MKLKELFEAINHLPRGYRDMDEYDPDRQRGITYEPVKDAVEKFRVVFYHPDRTNDGIDAPYLDDEITKKFGKKFATKRQALKYVNSPYIQNMIKQYIKQNKAVGIHAKSENDISSVNYNPETDLTWGIEQINLSEKGNYDRAEDESAMRYDF